MAERQLQERLFNAMKNLRCVRNGGFHVDMEVPVPYKHVYLPGQPPVLEIWCFKNDIVIFDDLFATAIPYKGAEIVWEEEPLVDVILEKDSAQNTKPVVLPYLIIETKISGPSRPNSHELLAYSQKAAMTKGIYPYCKFILVMFGAISARTYRHGYNFDDIFSLAVDFDAKDLKAFEKLLCKRLSEAQKDVSRLSGKKRIHNTRGALHR